MSVKVKRKYKATSGKAPFIYTWTTSDTCVTIDKANGSFTSEFETEFTFSSSACANSASIQLNITDSLGCSYSQAVSFADPCSTFVVEEISKVSQNVYNIYANQESTYTWLYDTMLYDATINGATLSLRPKYTTTPTEPTSITCEAVNAFGCKQVKYYQILFDPVTLYTSSVSSQASCATGESSIYVELNGTPNINWATLEFTLPENVTITKQEGNKVWLTATGYPNNGNESQRVFIKFKAKTRENIYANESSIIWNISQCNSDEDIYIESPNINATDLSIGSTIEIPIYKSPEIYVSKFVPTTSQTLISDRVLQTPFATVELFDNKIVYTFTSTPTGDGEVIQYVGVDGDGNFTKVVQTLISFNTIGEPVMPATPLVLCTECGGQTPFINFSKYVDDIVNPQSSRVVDFPSTGTVLRSSTGNLSYVGTNTDTTGVFFTVDFENKNGVRGTSKLRVNIENRCSGVANSVVSNVTCLPKIFNLIDLVSGTYSGTLLWEDYDGKYTAAGKTITNATTLGTVNFTGLAVGNYKFKLTTTHTNTTDNINCPTTQTTIVETYIGDQPDAGQITYSQSVGTAYDITIPVYYTTNPSNITVTNNGAAAVFINPPQIISGTLFFTIELSVGTNNLSVGIINDCNGTITRTATIEVTTTP